MISKPMVVCRNVPIRHAARRGGDQGKGNNFCLFYYGWDDERIVCWDLESPPINFFIKNEMADWTPKRRKVCNTRVQVRGLITSREGISTLQRPFRERLPVNPILFEYLIMLVLYILLKRIFLFFALLNVPFCQHIIKDDKWLRQGMGG